MNIIDTINTIKDMPESEYKRKKVHTLTNEYVKLNTTDNLLEVLYFLIDMFFEDYKGANNDFEYYSNVIQFLTEKYVETIYCSNMSSDNVELILSVAGVVYDLSYKYTKKVNLVRLALQSPNITNSQKLRALNMLLDGEPETTNVMSQEEIYKYKKWREELSK